MASDDGLERDEHGELVNGCGIPYPCPECDHCAYCCEQLPADMVSRVCSHGCYVPMCEACRKEETECFYCEAPLSMVTRPAIMMRMGFVDHVACPPEPRLVNAPPLDDPEDGDDR